ncbi:YesL family protein [Clostridium grantii]|uniref:Uncharacterized membrane protein YesL n=1 Tax=Clostridium grantii DSM 8605 TaxID=1121316 RepID=A0A1M5V2U9_9CLOT|nr:DUF624 domain-containing protein [Clostridium grantii]SHH69500.1 Uncharacterized membrane protein YesL [Clostridium grantii DSM 8605]
MSLFNQNSKQFDDNILYVITNYFSWIFVSNVYFILLNIPFIFMLTFGSLVVTEGYIPIFIASTITIGPSLTALYSTMGKLIRDKDISLTKSFFKFYKNSFKQSFLLWGLIVLLIELLYFDISLINANNLPAFLSNIFLSFIIIILFISLTMFPIISRFYFNTKDLLKLSFFYSFKRIKHSILNIIIVVAQILILSIYPQYTTFFVFSVGAYAIMYNSKDFLTEIEETLIPNK